MGPALLERSVARRIELPPPPSSLGRYRTALCVGRRLLLSAHGPLDAATDSGFSHVGRIGVEIDVKSAQAAARIAALNALASARRELGSLDRIDRIVSLTGYLNATQDFVEHAKVLDGASALLLEVFESAGEHVRTVVGVSSLPFEVPLVVEIEACIQATEEGTRSEDG